MLTALRTEDSASPLNNGIDMSQRLLLGLALGSGREGIDAVLVRVGGNGLAAVPAVERHVRHPLPPLVRDALRRGESAPRDLADAFAAAARQISAKGTIELRSILLAGLHVAPGVPFDSLGERVAEQTGVSVWCRFAERDAAAGGAGRPWTPAADYLLAKSDSEDRILIHLGHAASVLAIPAGGKITDLVAFDAAPAGQLLDALIRLGTREKESFDSGGTRAVQGKCHDDWLADWMTHPHLLRPPPKPLANEFGPTFATAALDAARHRNAGLADLLCTATHFVARSIAAGVRQFVPPTGRPRALFVSGGGVRNGFLWQLLQQQFPGEVLRRTDDLGMPALARNAAAAAMLAGLTLDGVAVNLPLLTGASGGRLVGRFIPGDPRNWAAVTARAAEQMWDYGQLRAA
ncbi:MAG: anhydro-N-acetylmuramic acid kinase [Gemmataceae bacterium]|nr:anhydro-N-acetylmuramic acid kinase [Gemmataceae bacterium]